MAQVAGSYSQCPEVIDYTPASALTAGDIVVVSPDLIGMAVRDCAASALGALYVSGRWKVPKTTAAITIGSKIYWDAAGDPDGGTAGTGAANALGKGQYMGIADVAAASGDDYVYIIASPVRPNTVPVNTVAAAGSAIGDSAALFEGFNVVSGADGTKGVQLPVAAAGKVVYLKGTTAGVLKVYPQSGSAINALSASAALSLTTGAMPSIFIASSATQWYSIPLVAS